MILAATENGVRDIETGHVALEGRDVTHVVATPEGLWAIADGHEVLHATAPDAWRTVGSIDGHQLRCVLPRADGTLFVGTAGAHVLRGAGGDFSVLSSFDTVPGRRGWKNPAAPKPDVWSLASAAESVLVGVHVGGVWRSDDDGETWQASLEPETDVHQVAASGSVAVAAAARGFGWSRDAGRSWSWTTKGLHASYLQAVALTGDAVFVGASSGPFSHDAAVYRAESLGTPFRRCADGVPEWFETNVHPHRLAAADDRVAVAVEEAVYVSQDGGRTWKVAATGLPAVRAVAVT